MTYDFTSILDRAGQDALAVDGLGTNPGMAPEPPAEGFDFRPSATFVFSMNAVPRLADTTDGVFRRLYFLPFKRRFSPSDPDFDPNIAAKLARPEVLRRGALLGLMSLGDLIRRGFLTPIPEMDEEVEEVKQDNDSVARWLYEEDVAVGHIDGKSLQEVYSRYTDWCKEAGERNPFSLRKFTARVKESTRFEGYAIESLTKWNENERRSVRTFSVSLANEPNYLTERN